MNAIVAVHGFTENGGALFAAAAAAAVLRLANKHFLSKLFLVKSKLQTSFGHFSRCSNNPKYNLVENKSFHLWKQTEDFFFCASRIIFSKKKRHLLFHIKNLLVVI